MTYTYATMAVRNALYTEIRNELIACGYDHAIHGSGATEALDMHGIALVRADPVEPKDPAQGSAT